jgi:hypothetical protein
MSTYGYVANAPIVYTDPLGLDKTKREDECPGGRWRGRGLTAGGVIGTVGYSSTTALGRGLVCVSDPSVAAPYVQRGVFVGVGAGGGVSYDLIQVENAPRRQDLYTKFQTSFSAFGGFGATGLGSGVSGSVNGNGFNVGVGAGAGMGAGANFSQTRPY